MFCQTRFSRPARLLFTVAGAFVLAPVIFGQALSKTATSAVAAQASQEPSAVAAAAQTPSSRHEPAASPAPTTAVLSGVVLDPSGAVIAGAEVLLRAKGSAKPKSTTTDRTGQFHFDGLVPGDYRLEVQRDGFQTWTKDITIEARTPVPLRVEMKLAPLNEQLTVSGSNGQLSTSASENADTVTLDQHTLNSLPIQGNDVLGAVTKIMGPSALAPGGVQLIVNGVPTSDARLPKSEIQEIKINKDPYSALFSSPGQKRIEITTKTGSQQYHGSVDLQYRGSFLNARNAFATVKPPEHLVYYGGSLSGPIGRNKKTTFMVNAEHNSDDMQATVYARTPTGTVSQNFPTPFSSTYASGLLDHQLNEANLLSLRYSYYDYSYDGKDVGGLNLPETAVNNSNHNHYVFIADRWVLTNKLINQLSLRLISSDYSTQSVLPGEPSIIVLGAFTGGGGQQSLHQTLNYFQLTDIFSWSHGKHLLKAGVNVPAITRWGVNDRSNFGGTFQFSSLQDYEQGKPFSFVQNQGNSRLVFWQKELGLFVQDEFNLRSNMALTFGLRYDWQNYVSNLKNFAPRFALAYAPGKSGKTVLRAGAGVFYQMTGGGAIMGMLRYNGHTMLQYVLTNPGFPDPFALGGVAQAFPSGIVQFAPNLRLPYVIQYSVGLERQITRSTNFTATYTGMQGFDQFLSRDINAPLPPNYVQRPNPSIATLRQIESAGRMRGNALKLGVNSNLGRFFNGGMEYEFATAYNNTDGIDWFPANQYSMAGEWGRSSYNARNSFSFFGTSNVRNIFSLGTILSIRSGLPYTETTGTDVYGTTFTNARPPGVSRNTLEGPGSISLDLRVSRKFSFGSGKAKGSNAPGLSFSVDAFNVLNHVNFDQPVGDLTSPFFGTPVSAGHARRLQLSVSFQF